MLFNHASLKFEGALYFCPRASTYSHLFNNAFLVLEIRVQRARFHALRRRRKRSILITEVTLVCAVPVFCVVKFIVARCTAHVLRNVVDLRICAAELKTVACNDFCCLATRITAVVVVSLNFVLDQHSAVAILDAKSGTVARGLEHMRCALGHTLPFLKEHSFWTGQALCFPGIILLLYQVVISLTIIAFICYVNTQHRDSLFRQPVLPVVHLELALAFCLGETVIFRARRTPVAEPNAWDRI